MEQYLMVFNANVPNFIIYQTMYASNVKIIVINASMKHFV
jgi:hypothetical protein